MRSEDAGRCDGSHEALSRQSLFVGRMLKLRCSSQGMQTRIQELLPRMTQRSQIRRARSRKIEVNVLRSTLLICLARFFSVSLCGRDSSPFDRRSTPGCKKWEKACEIFLWKNCCPPCVALRCSAAGQRRWRAKTNASGAPNRTWPTFFELDQAGQREHPL